MKFFTGSILWKINKLNNPCHIFKNRMRLSVNNRELTLNLKKIDDIRGSIEGEGDGASAGILTEMYFQNTYLKFYDGNLGDIRTVVDLGGNRGFFSLFMSQFAEKVIWVECRKEFSAVLATLVDENDIKNIVREECYVGGAGSFSDFNENKKSIKKILDDNNVSSIDFLKIDIEGSEFDLFMESGFLDLTKYIAMEVHPEFGDPNSLAKILRKSGFKTKMVNERFVETDEQNDIIYLFAEQTVSRQ